MTRPVETGGGENLPAVAAPAPLPAIAPSLLGTTKPSETLARAMEVAAVVRAIVDSNEFSVNLGGKRPHVEVDGWNALGSLLGIGVRVQGVRPFTDSQGAPGYEALVRVVRVDSGEVVAEARAICTRSDRNFKGAPESSLYSMAQTRATGKAYRVALSWMMRLAGYAGVPAEEMQDAGTDAAAAVSVAAVSPVKRFAEWYGALSTDDADALKLRLVDVGVEKMTTGRLIDLFGDAIATPESMLAALDALEAAQTDAALDADAEPVEGDVLPPPPPPSAAVRRNRQTEETTDGA